MANTPVLNGLRQSNATIEVWRHLFKLELHWCRIESRDRISNVMPDAEGLLFGLASKVNKKRVRIAIHNFSPPFLRCIDATYSLSTVSAGGAQRSLVDGYLF